MILNKGSSLGQVHQLQKFSVVKIAFPIELMLSKVVSLKYFAIKHSLFFLPMNQSFLLNSVVLGTSIFTFA